MTSTCSRCEAYAVRTVTLHGCATRVALCSQHYAEIFHPVLGGVR